jgi:hypothetical protein
MCCTGSRSKKARQGVVIADRLRGNGSYRSRMTRSGRQRVRPLTPLPVACWLLSASPQKRTRRLGGEQAEKVVRAAERALLG